MRKREARRSVLIAARIRTDGVWSDVQIRNISSRGMMLETRSAPQRGMYLEIARGSVRIAGRVAWSANGQCGISTREIVNVVDLTSGGATKAVVQEIVKQAAAPSAEIRHQRASAFAKACEFSITAALAASLATAFAGTAYAQLSMAMEKVETGLVGKDRPN